MSELTEIKQFVLELQDELEHAADDSVSKVFERAATPGYRWHGTYPFHDVLDAHGAAAEFWLPLRQAMRHLQRRQDIFFGGVSDRSLAGDATAGGSWVVSMGHFVGMFESPWLDIPPTGRMAFLRYCEFHRIENGRLAETYLLFDLIGLMHQAGVYPLPPHTGAEFIVPGPRTHDGILVGDYDPAEAEKTLALIQQMGRDLGDFPAVDMDPESLRRTWHEDMIWYGPSGIGSTMGITGFKRQHQIPFRRSLYANRRFIGHEAEIAEGAYGGWVGWPSLSVPVVAGGFLGMPATGVEATMRVVDIYRREGDKLAENWVFIDTPDFLAQQDLDILARMRELVSRS